MKNKRQKNYFVKLKEVFDSGSDAKARAETLRQTKEISHVVVDKDLDEYIVSYSIAKWYKEQCEKLKITW